MCSNQTADIVVFGHPDTSLTVLPSHYLKRVLHSKALSTIDESLAQPPAIPFDHDLAAVGFIVSSESLPAVNSGEKLSLNATLTMRAAAAPRARDCKHSQTEGNESDGGGFRDSGLEFEIRAEKLRSVVAIGRVRECPAIAAKPEISASVKSKVRRVVGNISRRHSRAITNRRPRPSFAVLVCGGSNHVLIASGQRHGCG